MTRSKGSLVVAAIVAALATLLSAHDVNALRYGNPCTSDADCDSGTFCTEWQDGTKTCEKPILTPVDPQIVGVLQPCQTDADCPSDNECSWLGGTAGEVQTHGNCIGRQPANPVMTPK